MSPLALPTGIVVFGTVATVLLLLGQLKNILVWPLGLIAATVAIVFVVRHGRTERPGSRQKQIIADVAVLLLVLLWGVFNVFYTSQHVFINRDPGIYTNTAAWLADHDNLRIEAPDVFGDVSGITPDSFGFHPTSQDGEQVYAQGLQLLPTFLGLGGRIVGESRMLHLNPFFGMTALLAVYAFARLLMRPSYALLATGALAVSLPLIYFSRDTYTEPLAATFTFGALALLWIAQKNRRLGLWFLAGLTAGAGTLTRIDGYLSVAALLAFAALFLALSKRSERKHATKQVSAFTLGMGITSLLGWLSLLYLSPVYLGDLKANFNSELILIASVTVLGAVLVAVAWRTKLLSRLDRLTKNWRAPAAASTVVAGALILASRPLWYTAYGQYKNGLTAGLQAAMGAPIEPTRTYAEFSAYWIAWYIGPILAVLSVAGVAIVCARAVKRRDLLLVAGIFVIVGTSLVYLITPRISPDHIWASRRLLPVILPGVAVYGALGFEKLRQNYLNRFKWHRVLVGVIAILIFAGPLFITAPFLYLRPFTQLTVIEGVCEAVPDNAAILWVGTAQRYLVQPTRSFCGIPAAGYFYQPSKGGPSTAVLAAAASNARENGYTPIIGVFGKQKELITGPGNQHALEQVSAATYQVPERTLTTPPNTIHTGTATVFMGIIQASGDIQPL